MKNSPIRQQEVDVILVWHTSGALSFSTHVLIEVIFLRHGEEGQDGGEVEEQQNISGGVDLALRNGPESKVLGADSRKSSLFWFRIPPAPHHF